MKKFFLIFFVFCLVSTQAFATRVFNERAETDGDGAGGGAGLDEVWSGGWNLTGGTETYDEDKATSAVAGTTPRQHNQCIEVITGAGENCFLSHSFGGDVDPYYCRILFCIHSYSIGDTGFHNIYAARDDAAAVFILGYYNSAGTIYPRIISAHNGIQIYIGHVPIALDTWYLLEARWDNGNSEWEWRINFIPLKNDQYDPAVDDPSDYVPGTITTGKIVDNKYMGATALGGAQAATLYFDNNAEDNEDWVGLEPRDIVGDEVIKIGVFTDPHYIANADLDGGVHSIDRAQVLKDYVSFFVNRGDIDLVLVTGDICNQLHNIGLAAGIVRLEEYEAAAAASVLDCPMFWGIGNHDPMDNGTLQVNVDHFITESDYTPTENFAINIGETWQLVYFNNAMDQANSWIWSAATRTWFQNTLANAETNGKKPILAAHCMYAQDWPGDTVLWRTWPTTHQAAGVQFTNFGGNNTVGQTVTFTDPVPTIVAGDIGSEIFITQEAKIGNGDIVGEHNYWGSGTISAVVGNSISMIVTRVLSNLVDDSVNWILDSENPRSLFSTSSDEIQTDITTYVTAPHTCDIKIGVSGHSHELGGVRETAYAGGVTIPYYNLNSTWPGYYDYEKTGYCYIITLDTAGDNVSIDRYDIYGHGARQVH